MNDDPAAFLNLPPSDEGKLLAEQTDIGIGAPVPFWMFAEVAIRTRRLSASDAGRADLEKKIRRRAAAGLAALAANLVLLFGYAAHRLEASGAAEEHAAQVEQRLGDRAVQQEQRSLERRDVIEREIEDLRRQLSEIRADLRRLSRGGDPKQIDGTDDLAEPDGRFANLLNDISSMLAGGRPVPPRPAPDSTCGAICSSNVECGGLIQTCRFCNFGTCKSTRPESPVRDAGVDAPAQPEM